MTRVADRSRAHCRRPGRADGSSQPLAGGEFAFDVAEVRPALDSGHLVYLMPDVEHAGGITGAFAVTQQSDWEGAPTRGEVDLLENTSGTILR